MSVSVTSRSVDFFGMEASFDLSYSVLMCYNEIQVSTKIRVLPSGTLL